MSQNVIKNSIIKKTASKTSVDKKILHYKVDKSEIVNIFTVYTHTIPRIMSFTFTNIQQKRYL